MAAPVVYVGSAAPARPRQAPPAGSRIAIGDDLLARVGRGDHAAFASLYDHLAPAAYGIAHRVVGNAALAEEITQDAFLQVWTARSTFDRKRGSAQSWVLTIVHRRAVDVVRHEQAARTRVLRVGPRYIDRTFDEVWATALHHAERDEVLAALKALTAGQRQAIQLAYYDGMTCGEVAQHLGIPVGTAKSRILEGVRRLRREFATA